jgi:hypothetical protein
MRGADFAWFIHLRPGLIPRWFRELGLASFVLFSLCPFGAPSSAQALIQTSVQTSVQTSKQGDGSEKSLNPFAYACPLLLKPLLNEIWEDFPSYINRSIQRQSQAGNSLHYLIGLSQPDYRPADLTDFNDRHPEFKLEPLLNSPGLYQVFLTSRQRTYETDQIVDFQEFHWLLFQQDDRYQWHLRAMISQDQQGNLRNNPSDPIAEGIQQRLAACWSIGSDSEP